MKKKALRAAYILLNLLIALAVLCAIFYGLWRLDIIRPPAFITRFLPNDGTEIILPGDEGRIYDSLQPGNEFEGITVYPHISHENLRELIRGIPAENNYYWEARTTIYSQKASLKNKCVLRYYDGKYRIELYDAGGGLTKLITDDKTQTVVANARGGRSVFPAGSFSAASQAGVAEVEKFLETPKDALYEYTLVESDLGDLLNITFEYSYGDFLQKEVFWISLDYGLVVRAKTYENGELTYLLETERLTSLPTPPDSLFQG